MVPRAIWPRPIVVIPVAALALAGGAQSTHAGEFVPEDGSDFDCDGVRDLVNFSPDTVDGVVGAGAVSVTYSGGGEDYLTQATPGVPGVPEHSDYFGWRYTALDRDLDGCDELVVGVPWEDVGSASNAGMITIIPGSPAGLDPARSEGYTQDSPGYPGGVEALDWFGQSLAAGTTHQGEPFLLIGSPGEGGAESSTRDSGSVYYVRAGSVSMFHQDSPGVAGRREIQDNFGRTLAASDRYFAVGSPGEGIEDNRDGMVHVFSHTLTDGRPTAVGAFHQNTPGISGKAEGDDKFGRSLSVLSFRPSGGGPAGALVAVGSEETVGSAQHAGMAHLVYVSPTGDVSQRAAVTQDTPGVTGAPEDGDYLGWNVALANLDPDRAVATPETTAWAAAVGFEQSGAGLVGAVHVFPPAWQAGEPDVWLKEGRFGLGFVRTITALRASDSHLHVGPESGPCNAVPWQNLLGDGELQPVTTRAEPCAYDPGLI